MFTMYTRKTARAGNNFVFLDCSATKGEILSFNRPVPIYHDFKKIDHIEFKYTHQFQ